MPLIFLCVNYTFCYTLVNCYLCPCVEGIFLHFRKNIYYMVRLLQGHRDPELEPLYEVIVTNMSC